MQEALNPLLQGERIKLRGDRLLGIRFRDMDFEMSLVGELLQYCA
jgi:hypothetical protein